MKEFDVAIIGAGTAGLSARREVAKKTQNYLVIDDGPLGTTCARVGCMPSKVFIQVANDFARRKKFSAIGIHGAESLSVDPTAVMNHVRNLRDRFVRSVRSPMGEWESQLLRGRAKFVDPHTLQVGEQTLRAEKIILAVGSRPILPKPWLPYRELLIDTDHFFEMPAWPESMAVIGLGIIGVELGQAINKLGVRTVGITQGKGIAGLSDPTIQEYVREKFAEEFPLHINGANIKGISSGGKLQIEADDQVYEVDKALISVGRRSNIDTLGIENLNLILNSDGLPEFHFNTMKLKEHPHLFLAGDVNIDRPVLHEAADEGTIAGYNAVNPEQCFMRRAPIGIAFSEPNVAFVGRRYQELLKDKTDFVTGAVSFEGQGRSIVKLQEQGLLHVYADKYDGTILGAEMQAPSGEHLAHLLAWAISVKLSVKEALKMPFYHPVIEEGLRTALRHCAEQITCVKESELSRCQDPPIR